MTLPQSLQARCIQVAFAACVIALSSVAQNASAQSAFKAGSSYASQAQDPSKQPNPKDSNPSLPGDRSQVGGNDVLKPMTIEQQKAEAQKKSELVELQKKAYEHAVENMLEAVD